MCDERYNYVLGLKPSLIMSQHTLTKPSVTCDHKVGYQNDNNVGMERKKVATITNKTTTTDTHTVKITIT